MLTKRLFFPVLLSAMFAGPALAEEPPPPAQPLEQKFVLQAVEPRDASARLEQTRRALIGRGEQEGADIGALAQFLEKFVADLLRTAAQHLWMVQADQKNPCRHLRC